MPVKSQQTHKPSLIAFDGFEASVVLVCKCGQLTSMFNGDLGMCKNQFCEYFNQLFCVHVILGAADEETQLPA